MSGANCWLRCCRIHREKFGANLHIKIRKVIIQNDENFKVTLRKCIDFKLNG